MPKTAYLVLVDQQWSLIWHAGFAMNMVPKWVERAPNGDPVIIDRLMGQMPRLPVHDVTVMAAGLEPSGWPCGVITVRMRKNVQSLFNLWTRADPVWQARRDLRHHRGVQRRLVWRALAAGHNPLAVRRAMKGEPHG